MEIAGWREGYIIKIVVTLGKAQLKHVSLNASVATAIAEELRCICAQHGRR